MGCSEFMADGDVFEKFRDAFRRDDAEAVRALLEQEPQMRSKINEPLGPFDSPLIVSAQSRAMLDALLDAGADINARSRWWAGSFGILDSVKPELAAYAIERGAKLDAHSAARLGMRDKLREFISQDPSAVHARGGDGQTPLHFASTVEVAGYLLDAGARIDARDIDHESTPAQWMIGERTEVARYLVGRGCKSDILIASALGDLGLAEKHLDADPSCVAIRVNAQWFPMQNPRAGGHIYQWTLGFDASPHQVARKFGHQGMLDLLIRRSPATVQFVNACWIGDAGRAKELAKNGDIVARLSDSERQQIAHAARNNDVAAVALMLETGFPVDAPGQHGGTPLHWACFHGNAAMARLILRHKPSLEIRDRDFSATPLGWAIYGSEHGWHCQTGDYAQTAQALLDAGAKPPEKIGGSQALQAVFAG